MNDARSYLLIIGEREALAWVLRESRMAFPPTRRAEVDRLAGGDELYIFTTRGCWHNPSRDRGRVIGHAVVTSPVVAYDRPVEIAGREFTRGCGIEIRSLAPVREGVELAPLVPRLAAFPEGNGWGVRLRRPLLELPATDAALIRDQLAQASYEPGEVLRDYLDRVAALTR